MYKLLEAAQAITLACGCHARCNSFDAKSFAPPLKSDGPGLPSDPVPASNALMSVNTPIHVGNKIGVKNESGQSL